LEAEQPKRRIVSEAHPDLGARQATTPLLCCYSPLRKDGRAGAGLVVALGRAVAGCSVDALPDNTEGIRAEDQDVDDRGVGVVPSQRSTRVTSPPEATWPVPTAQASSAAGATTYDGQDLPSPVSSSRLVEIATQFPIVRATGQRSAWKPSTRSIVARWAWSAASR
jgi:hypothetical protein